jgi:ActR/RegA family two-component response regulator
MKIVYVAVTNDMGDLRDWDVIQREILATAFCCKKGNISKIADEMGEHRKTMQRRFHSIGLYGAGEPHERNRK